MATSIDSRLLEKNNWMGMYCILHGYALWLGFGGMAWLAWTSSWPVAWRAIAVLAAVALSGLGMFYITTLSHEGFHGSLNRRRHVSMVMGVLASSAVPSFLAVGYTIRHWHHHLYTNTLQDPDYADYHRYRSFLARVAWGPSLSSLAFLRNVVFLFVSPQSVDLRHYPFPLPVLRRYAVLNLVASGLFLALYAYMALAQPIVMLTMLLLPSMVLTVYLGIVPFIDHAETGLDKGMNARSYTSGFFSLMFLGTNYHREHHLHPSAPSYRLGRIHRLYRAHGDLRGAHVEPSLTRALWIGVSKNLDA